MEGVSIAKMKQQDDLNLCGLSAVGGRFQYNAASGPARLGWDVRPTRPMDERDARARETQDAIRDVLIKYWDPLAIQSDPEWPRDEYDPYIGRVYRLLASGSTEDQVIAYLAAIDPTGEAPRDLDSLRPAAFRLLGLVIRL